MECEGKTIIPQVKVVSGSAVRTIEENKVGFHFANLPCEKNVQIEKARKSARIADARYQWPITFPGPQKYSRVREICDPAIENAEVSEVVNYWKELRGELHNNGITTKGTCYCRTSNFTLENSEGLNVGEKSTFFVLDMDVTKEEKTFNVVAPSRLWEREVTPLVECIKEHVSWYSGRKREPVLNSLAYGSRALYALLRPLLWQLSVDRVKRRISSLKLDSSAAGESFTLYDDGTYPNGVGTSVCDGEGVASRRACIIEKGMLRSIFYDHFHALLDGRRSTGNAVRTSMMAPPKIAPRTLVVKEGDYSLSEFTGTLIEEFFNDKGAHLVSGEYVFNVKRAFCLKDGEVLGVANPFVLKGNVFNPLHTIYGVGVLRENSFPSYRELVTPYVFSQISS